MFAIHIVNKQFNMFRSFEQNKNVIFTQNVINTLKYWGGSLIIGFWRLKRVYLLKDILSLNKNIYSQELFPF